MDGIHTGNHKRTVACLIAQVPLWVRRMGGHAVVKVPVSAAPVLHLRCGLCAPVSPQ